MKKFKFRYESVLKMRMDLEDQIKNELARLIKKRQVELDSLDLLVKKETEYLMHIEQALSKGGAQKEMHTFSEGKAYYRKRREIINHRIQKLDRSIDAKKNELVEAMRSRKIMDKLKEKAFQEFIEAVNEADAKLIEEVVNYKNNRTNGDE